MKKKNFWQLLTIGLVVSVGFAGCKKDEGDTSESQLNEIRKEEMSFKGYHNISPTDTVKMKSNVVYVKKDISDKLKRIDEKTKTAVFTDSETLNKMAISVGDILYSPFVEDKGYALKIKSISRSEDEIVYTYEEALPGDVFEEYYKKMDYSIDEEKIQEFDISSIITSNTDKSKSKQTYKEVLRRSLKNLDIISHDKNQLRFNFLLHDLDGDKETKSDQINLSVKFTHDFSDNEVVFDKKKKKFLALGNPRIGIEGAISFFKIDWDNEKIKDDIKKYLREKEREQFSNGRKFTDWKQLEAWKKEWSKKWGRDLMKSNALGKKIPIVRIPLKTLSPADFVVKSYIDIYAVFELSVQGELILKIVYSNIHFHYEVEEVVGDGNPISAKFDVTKKGEFSMSLESDLDIKATGGLGVGLTLRFPWKYGKNDESYVGFYSDLTLDSQLDASAAITYTPDEKIGTQCKKIELSSDVNWNLYTEGKLGMFRKKLIDFKYEFLKVPVDKFNRNFDLCTQTWLTILEKETKVAVGVKTEIPIYGNGEYRWEANSDIAKIVVDDLKVEITGEKEGQGVLTIIDSKTNQREKINLSVVSPNFAIEKENISLLQGETAQIRIVKGSTLSPLIHSENINIAGGTVANGIISINGYEAGTTTIIVTDPETKETKSILVTVTVSDIINLNKGLIAYYPFDGDANDKIEGNNGTVFGAMLTTDRKGKANSAYDFDGVDDYIEVKNSTALTDMQNITLNVWVNINKLYSQGGYNYFPIIEKSNNKMKGGKYHLSYVEEIGVSFRFIGRKAVKKQDIPLGNWVMITAIYQNDSYRLYYNGKLIDVSKGVDVGAFIEDGDLIIGKDVPGLIEYANGKIDDIRIYNRALSNEEIQKLYRE